MQSVAAVVSIAILEFSTCIEHLQNPQIDATEFTDDNAPYIGNTATILKFVTPSATSYFSSFITD
jgi:hypothetical protein